MVFGRSLGTPFIWDDEELILKNPLLSRASCFITALNPSYWKQSAFPEDYRPVETWTYCLDHFFWGLNPAGYHLSNLLIHAFNCVALSLLVLLLSQSVSLAAVAGIVFALHPAHIESVIWIQNRSELLALAFGLVALIACAGYVLYGRNRGMLFSIAFAAALLASLSKETALIVPLLCAAVMIFYGSSTVRRFLAFIIPLALAAGGILAMKLIFMGPHRITHGSSALAPGSLPHFLTIFKTTALYLALLCFPANFSIDREMAIPDPAHPIPGILCGIASALVIASAVYSFRRRNKAGLALALTLIPLIPVCNVYFIAGRAFAEQRVYFASAGFCYLIALALRPVLNRRPAVLILIALAFVYFTSSLNRTGYWLDEKTLWKHTFNVSPYSWKARVSLARLSRKSRRYDESIILSKNILRGIYPRPAMFYIDLGKTYKAMGWMKQAAMAAEKAVSEDPQSREARILLGDIYRAEARNEDALAQYRLVEKKWPLDDSGYLKSAILLREEGRNKAALAEAGKALSLSPANAEAMSVIASSYSDIGDAEKASDYFQKALRADPSSGMVLNGYGIFLERSGCPEKAAVIFEKAARAAPLESVPHYNLAQLHMRAGEKFQSLIELMRAAQREPGKSEYLREINRLSGELQSKEIPPDLAGTILEEHLALLAARGEYCCRVGNTAAARESFEKLVQLAPTNGAARADLGRFYLQQGEYRNALAQLKTAAGLLPDEPAIYLQMWKCYRKLGRSEEAKKCLRKAVSLDPGARLDLHPPAM